MQSPESSSVGSVVGTSSVSSRACQNCSRAKAKCVPQSDQHGECTRCFRLKKECIVLPKSTRKRRSPNAAKNTAQLEQKIENLVSLLSATQGTALPSRPPEKQAPPEPLSQEIQQDDIRRPDHRPAFSWHVDPTALPAKSQPSWDSMVCGRQNPVTITLCSTATPASTSESVSAPSIDLRVDNPEHLLKVYREYYESEFPFVRVPPNITSQELKATKPWLAITLSMVASHENRTQQLALAKHIIMEISAALFLRSEKSLDLLEALIIFNIWQYYYAPINPQYQTTAVIQLALAVLFDLGLNKPLREYECGPPDLVADTFRLANDNAREIRRSSEERRAFLSCFILTSTSSSWIKRIDGLEHTSYLDYTCQSLFEAAEYESDFLLVFAARSQSLIDFMSMKFLNGGPGSDDIKAPAPMHAKAVKAELENFFTALPQNLQQHTLARRSYHSAEVFINEPSLHRSLFPTSLNSQRLDMLYACLTSAKALLDIFSTLPTSSYYGMSITSLAQLGHVLSTAFKLSFIEVPGWDLAHVRSTVNLLQYFKHFISEFEKVGAQIDNSRPAAKRSFPTGCALAMGRVKGWYENRTGVDTEARQQEEQTGLMGMEDILSGEKFDYWDDAYYMGDWQALDFTVDFMQQ